MTKQSLPDDSEDPASWKREMCKLLERLEDSVPMPPWAVGAFPVWVERAMREFLKTLIPDAKFKAHPEWTPRELGALVGTKIGMFQWLLDPNGFAKSQAAAVMDRAVAAMTQQQAQELEAVNKPYEEGMAKQLANREKIASECLALIGTATVQEQAEFLDAYRTAMLRAEKGFDVGSFGTTATPVYVLLILSWQSVERLPSIGALHKACQARLGRDRVGSLKTFEKLCQRIGLKIRGRGRPSKAK
jgi:hypothetical protein